ncbi:branched-chain amino acid ABC transporter permease [Enterovirga sp.]|jgi:branched-chain amino acid transport system permease protein|uniref:branched-chain amino acid ABC transporter permease n=1 Tax=Enterovirga sp. TaxID=2026350 RepID=UPI0026080A2B|nr:branched-chain amino acid ABC transporter permease [Enterovirga sp.]MDB5592977.1 branched-chain amino acid transporter permease [Enterovirga sp.]
MSTRSLAIPVWAVCALVLLLVPAYGSPTFVDLAFRTASLIVLAISWNLMASAGLISLGHSAFFGLGGYVGILSANLLGAPFWLSLVGAVIAGTLLGSGLALITGRMRGIYFAITTLAASEGLRVIAVMLPDLTGGAKGAYLKAATFPGVLAINLAMSLVAVAACIIAWMVSRSRFHYAFRAMRANEAASQMLGIFPLKYRTAIMALSGGMASLVGGVEVWHGGYLDPAVAFDLHITITSQIAPILGGIYTLSGPILGAIATVFLGDATRIALGHLQGASLLVFGLVLVFCVLYLPQGIQGGLLRMLGKRPSEAAAEPKLSPTVATGAAKP